VPIKILSSKVVDGRIVVEGKLLDEGSVFDALNVAQPVRRG